jgi:hypothetical protein
MTEVTGVYLTSDKVRKRYDNINPVTLQRWVRNKEMGFPQPMVIGRRWYFKLTEIEEWERKRQEEGKP